MNDYQKLSVDLAKISEYILQGNVRMAEQYTEQMMRLYKDLPGTVGKYSLSEYLMMIARGVGGDKKTAERALLASELFAHYEQ